MKLKIVKISFWNNLKKCQRNENLWNSISEHFHVVNQSSFTSQSEEMRQMSSKLLNISLEIDEIMPSVRYLIDKTLRRAERTPNS